MLALIPLVNFCVITGVVSYVFFDTLRLSKALLSPKVRGCTAFLFFLLFLPWNLAVITLILGISAIPAVLAFPFIVLPSYYLNIKFYLSIMKYWWSGNRFEGGEPSA